MIQLEDIEKCTKARHTTMVTGLFGGAIGDYHWSYREHESEGNVTCTVNVGTFGTRKDRTFRNVSPERVHAVILGELRARELKDEEIRSRTVELRLSRDELNNLIGACRQSVACCTSYIEECERLESEAGVSTSRKIWVDNRDLYAALAMKLEGMV